jgi:hypothetical protein
MSPERVSSALAPKVTVEPIEGCAWRWTMGSNGGVFKRCGCRDPHSGRLLGTWCPALAERGHGSWYFDCAVAGLQGRRERVRRGGYPTCREALAARDAMIRPGSMVGRPRRGRWLDGLRYWLTSRTSIRPSTQRSYQHRRPRVVSVRS